MSGPRTHEDLEATDCAPAAQLAPSPAPSDLPYFCLSLPRLPMPSPKELSSSPLQPLLPLRPHPPTPRRGKLVSCCAEGQAGRPAGRRGGGESAGPDPPPPRPQRPPRYEARALGRRGSCLIWRRRGGRRGASEGGTRAGQRERRASGEGPRARQQLLAGVRRPRAPGMPGGVGGREATPDQTARPAGARGQVLHPPTPFFPLFLSPFPPRLEVR